MSAMEMEITPQKSSKKQDSRVQQDESNQDNTPMVEGKRKRRKNDEEAELARRRRRRQSLAFQQRRKSLTPSKNKSGDTPTKQKRQYISDMYATVIKMSSENKINVKNSWSLHLIDHIDDILQPQEKNTVEDTTVDEVSSLSLLPSSSGVNTVNTFNFQKASCTLDASVKIYSYRVDDTWNSSFKILENLSRTEEKHPAENDDQSSPNEATSRKKNTSKKVTSGRTLEKNLNNINLKSYEMEYEVDPLFHKMSQTFDEGGAKGMLMANLGVYEGCKILLNSCDVQYSTRKSLHPTKEEQGHTCPATSKINIVLFQKKLNTTIPDGVQDLDICPPIQRLYCQIEDLQGQDVVKNKISFRSSLSLNSFAVNNMEVDEDDDDDEDDVGEDGDQNDTNIADHISTPQKINTITEIDEGIAMDVDDDNSVQEATEDQQEQEVDNFCMDTQEDMEQADAEENGHSTIETQEDILSSHATSEYFSASKEKQEQEQTYSMIIENALVHSFSEGLQNDYSYFDMKALKNWAGPAHWKFPTGINRRLKTKKTILEQVVEEQEQEEQKNSQDSKAIAPVKESKKSKKASRAEQNTSSNGIIDFVSGSLLDLSILTKKPRESVISSTLLSKLSLKRSVEKAGDFVLPVDSHIKVSSLFHLFMKPSLRFFHHSKGGRAPANGLHSEQSDIYVNDDDDGEDGYDMEFGVEGHGNDHEGQNLENEQSIFGGLEDDYSGRQLLKAERIIEKIDVHYEKIAKRVDVKKLKKSIWDHLEKEEKILTSKQEKELQEERRPEDMIDKENMTHETENQMQTLSNEFNKAQISTCTNKPTTSFAHVVENVAVKVPSNVTVSFYFICMLHLANEKGLELKGQEDLSDFQIRAGNNNSHMITN